MSEIIAEVVDAGVVEAGQLASVPVTRHVDAGGPPAPGRRAHPSRTGCAVGTCGASLSTTGRTQSTRPAPSRSSPSTRPSGIRGGLEQGSRGVVLGDGLVALMVAGGDLEVRLVGCREKSEIIHTEVPGGFRGRPSCDGRVPAQLWSRLQPPAMISDFGRSTAGELPRSSVGFRAGVQVVRSPVVVRSRWRSPAMTSEFGCLLMSARAPSGVPAWPSAVVAGDDLGVRRVATGGCPK